MVKSLDHDSADATGSWTCGEDCVVVRIGEGEYVLDGGEVSISDGDSPATRGRLRGGVWVVGDILSDALLGPLAKSAAAWGDGAGWASSSLTVSVAMSCPEATFMAPLLVVAFGFRKLFRLCWPLPGIAALTETAELDLAFLDVLLPATSVGGRFLSTPVLTLATFEDEPVALACDEALDITGVTSTAWTAISTGTVGSPLPNIEDIVPLDDCIEVLRANISRMFLRPSNSGMSRPDSGKMSLAEYSLWRWPFSNMPTGFMRSTKNTSLPSFLTLSLKVAYTGQ